MSKLQTIIELAEEEKKKIFLTDDNIVKFLLFPDVRTKQIIEIKKISYNEFPPISS